MRNFRGRRPRHGRKPGLPTKDRPSNSEQPPRGSGFTPSLAANLQPESQKLPCRTRVTSHARDFTGRSGVLRGARTHFLIRRTESENISFEGAGGIAVRRRQRGPQCLASVSPPVLPVNLAGAPRDANSMAAPRGARSAWPNDALIIQRGTVGYLCCRNKIASRANFGAAVG